MRDLLQGLTPESFNALILLVMAVGLVLAAVRLYRDLARPLPPPPDDVADVLRELQEDTRPRRPDPQ